MTANTKTTKTATTDTFDPLQLLAAAMAELEPVGLVRAGKGSGAAVVPIAPIGLEEHLSALSDAKLAPIQGAAGYVVRYGGTPKGLNPAPKAVKRRTGTQLAAHALLTLLRAGQPVPVRNVYRMALALTGQTPAKPVEPEQILMAMAAQAGQAITVAHDGTVALSTLPRGAKGESRLIKV